MSTTKKTDHEGLSETVVNVRRVTKVAKGGRKFSFSACVIVGNKEGLIGYGYGKAKEASDAKTKASQDARKNLIEVPLDNGTIYHDVRDKNVVIRRAKPGTGIIAGGVMRALFHSLGIQDIVAKYLGSSNVPAKITNTLNALSKISSPKSIAAKRDRKIDELSTKHLAKKISKDS